MSIEYWSINFLYKVLKDIWNFFCRRKEQQKYHEREKIVNEKYVSNVKTTNDVRRFYWSNPDKVESKKLEGWEYFYQTDHANRIKYILKKSGQILLVKKTSYRVKTWIPAFAGMTPSRRK